MRAALYIRVSTAEQAMHGYSLAAQEELLRQYAAEHGHTVVGVYADEGKSASHNLDRRKALLRMVEDAEAGKVQTILFKDITRWSRKASDYYRIQDRLDKCGCSWIAVQQPYLETLTPTGRFQVSVMLGTAQLEAEQTSERIKFTSASRITKGGVLYGSAQCPIGYKVGIKDGAKRMIIDESTAELARDMFRYYLQTQNISKTVRYMLDAHGKKMYEVSVRNALRNPIYIGTYHGIEGYTDPLVSAKDWEAVQRSLEKRAYTAPRNDRYIFTSLLTCAECGHHLTGCYNKPRYSTGKDYIWYQCKEYRTFRTCTHSRTITQQALETAILDRLAPELDKYIVEAKALANSGESARERKRLEAKLSRTKELYIDGDITKEDYAARSASIRAQLNALPSDDPQNLDTLQAILDSDWRAMYESLDFQRKKVFWRSILKEVVIDQSNTLTIHFLT